MRNLLRNYLWCEESVRKHWPDNLLLSGEQTVLKIFPLHYPNRWKVMVCQTISNMICSRENPHQFNFTWPQNSITRGLYPAMYIMMFWKCSILQGGSHFTSFYPVRPRIHFNIGVLIILTWLLQHHSEQSWQATVDPAVHWFLRTPSWA